MTGSLGEAVLDLAADASGLFRDINKARPEALNALEQLGHVGGMLLAAGITIAATAVVGLTALIWNSGNTLDEAYDTIQARTGATGQQLEQLKADFDQVFSSVPADAQTAADTIGILNARLKGSGPIFQGLAKDILEFSRLTKTDAVTNAESFSQVISNWKIPIEGASVSLDTVFVAAQKTGVPVEQLMQDMVSSGPILRQYGFDFYDAAAFISETNQAGIDATSTMMGLKSAAAKFAATNVPLAKGLQQTIDKIKSAKDPTQALNLAVDIFGARAGPAMVDAIRSGKLEFADLAAQLHDVDGAIRGTSEQTMDWGERWTMFKNKMTVALGPAGLGLMDAASTALNAIAAAATRPDVQAGLMTIVNGISQLAQSAATYLPVAIDQFFQFVSFLQQNQGIVIAALAAIGVAIAAFIYTAVIPAAIAALTAIAPILLIIGLVAAAAYLMYQAWTNNWGGIRDLLQGFWIWLQPVLLQLWSWLSTNIPLALQTLAGFWTGTLLPAITAVWGWMSGTLFPFFMAMGNFLGAVFSVILTAMAGIWQNVLGPALQAAWSILATKLMPVFQALATFWTTTLYPIVQAIATWIGQYVVTSFQRLTSTLQTVSSWLNTIASKLNTMKLPAWMTPGSPTPWEMGLWGVNDALEAVGKMSLPSLSANMNMMPAPALASGGGMALASGGGAIQMQFVYSPFVSTKDEHEAELALTDIVNRINRKNANK